MESKSEVKAINITFSKKLLYWLEQRGKTQADLAKRLNVSTAVVSDWCNEKKIPRADKIVDIAGWLLIEVSDLLEEKERSHDIIEDILFRIKDDTAFFETVKQLYLLNATNFGKADDYIKLLSK